VRLDATGIVLAGGSSRRMGQDKSVIELGGRTLLQRAAESVSSVCNELVIAAADRPVQHLPNLSPIWVPDAPGATGPLAGLAAGLSAASYPVAVVVACDMPFLNDRLLWHLLNSLADCDAVVPMAEGRAQPLHAAYSRDCLPTVRALLRLGAKSMHDLLSRLRVKYITESRCLELDPDGLSSFNMNTIDDFRFASYHWAHRQDRVAAA
jgi:molybdopterin-guanine dinucleotide biosynthesis protein A